MSTAGFSPDSIDGFVMTEEDCANLHKLKNSPDRVPVIKGVPMQFPPYQYRAYPRAMYHAKDETSPRLVKDEQEERNLLSRGWSNEPDKAEAAFEEWRDKTIAIPAAERAYADRNMSDKAKAELKALEHSADDHIVDVPAPRRGRPRKTQEPPTAA